MRNILLLATLPLLIGATGTASVEVAVNGIRSTRGALLVCVWRDKTGFPTCGKSKTAVRQRLQISGGAMRVRFPSLPPGSYAVSVEHDEDGDGKLKTNFIGMPKEGVGISNNPGGIPGFGKAQIRVGSGTAIAVTMRYL